MRTLLLPAAPPSSRGCEKLAFATSMAKELNQVTGVVANDHVRTLIRPGGKGSQEDLDVPGSECCQRPVEIVDNEAGLEQTVNAVGFLGAAGLGQRDRVIALDQLDD